MSVWLEVGGVDTIISSEDATQALHDALGRLGDRRRVLALPPDFTRFHSRAGELTSDVWNYYGDRLAAVLPALGTHTPMTPAQLDTMFGDVPRELFRVHDWRNDVTTLGEVPSTFICEQSEGKLNYTWPAQVNRMLVEGNHDLILSIGQVVPHEVIGMANFNKNVLIGTGGPDGINRSHFLGAVYGMERIMGRADTPVRRVLNYGMDQFGRNLPIVYVLTVVDRDETGDLVMRGLFVGDDLEVFEKASALSLKVNFQLLDREIRKAIVYLDPYEYRSTWLGNKAVYRTRMALADGADLIILAPGVKEFGEDPVIDKLIRKHGYRCTEETLAAVERDPELQANLSAPAHLIHGSSEGRFTITYCPGHMSKEEIEGVGYRYAHNEEMMAKYDPRKLADGFNYVDGEEVFFISNPALGLWAYRGRFE